MGRVSTPKTSHQPTREAEELRQSHAALTTQVQTHPIFANGNVRELDGVTFVATVNKVLRLGLGRVCKRWLILHVASGTPDLSFVAADKDTLTLVSANDCKVDLWVM